MSQMGFNAKQSFNSGFGKIFIRVFWDRPIRSGWEAKWIRIGLIWAGGSGHWVMEIWAWDWALVGKSSTVGVIRFQTWATGGTKGCETISNSKWCGDLASSWAKISLGWSLGHCGQNQ